MSDVQAKSESHGNPAVQPTTTIDAVVRLALRDRILPVRHAGKLDELVPSTT